MKLSTRLLSFTTINMVITMFVVGVLSYFFTSQSLQSLIETQQLELARQTIDKVDRVLKTNYTDVQTIAADRTIGAYINTAAAKASSDNIFTQDFLKSIAGMETNTGPWDTINIIDNQGVFRYSNDSSKIGTNIKQDTSDDLGLFQKSLAGQTLYQDAEIDPVTQKPIITFASPIIFDNGSAVKIIGVVMNNLSWRSVSEVINSIQGSKVDLYNSSGLEIANNNDLKAIFKENNGNYPVVKSALQGKELSQVSKGVDGVDSVNSAVREKGFLEYKGNNWVLLISQPTSVAFIPAINGATKIIIVLISLTAFSYGLILFLTLRLLKPIDLLTKSAKEIASGDLSKRVPISSNDEIGQLGLAFNEMASKLQELYQNLEKKVAEKTSQLTQTVTEIDEQKKILNSILENLPVGVALSEAPSGKTILVNRAGINLFGRENTQSSSIQDSSKDTSIQTDQIFNVDGTSYSPMETTLAIALQKAIASTKDNMVIHRPDNTKIFLRSTSVPIKNIKNEITSVVSVFEDITHEKEVDRMKTEFISLASHQLRTPLSAIKWFTEMLLAGDAGKLSLEQEDFAKNISESTERMIDLVNALLNISRIESGRILIDPKPTDLKAMVESIVKELQQKITKKEQQFIISVHDELPKISIDPLLINQVYMNLLTNAIKYTQKKGEITVFISRKGDEIISQVSDNGYGIPKSQQGKIFQKFFRAENVAKIETDGTGLGLYLIKAIVESSKGRIWFSSEEGKGTSFWFSLPVAGTPAKQGEVTLDG